MLDLMRQRRFRSAWLPLLMVAVFARALLPSGFMPTVLDGRPALGICGPAAALIAGNDALHEGAAADSSATCPFALGATLAPPPAPLVSILALPRAGASPPVAATPQRPTSHSRAHAPRGPPALA
jgi:hypothetical protein